MGALGFGGILADCQSRRGHPSSVGGSTAAAPRHIGPQISVAGIVRNRREIGFCELHRGARPLSGGQPESGIAMSVGGYSCQ